MRQTVLDDVAQALVPAAPRLISARGRVESRMGASTDAERRPVSHPRSSNRTCRFPASGFPTGFTVDARTSSILRRATASEPPFFAVRYSLIGRIRIQWCLQACANHRTFPPSQAHQKQGPFPPPGVARPLRSYGPLRLPDWPPPLLTTLEARPSTSPEPPPLAADRLPHMPCSLPRWTSAGARWLSSCAIPRGSLPCPYSLPRFSGGSASTSSLSRPAQASHALRPARLLTHLSWALSRGSALTGFPARTLASYQVQPTTSLGGSFPHW